MRVMRHPCVAVLAVLMTFASCGGRGDGLRKLDKVIADQKYYRDSLERSMNMLREELDKTSSDSVKWEYARRLFSGYYHYSQDSSSRYQRLMERYASDDSQRFLAKIQKVRIFLIRNEDDMAASVFNSLDTALVVADPELLNDYIQCEAVLCSDMLSSDISEEEKDAEEQIEKTGLEMDADGFADWEDSSDGAPEDETLEEALAEERTLELESELEQDEHPRDYHAELEDEEEEAAPTSEKRLKREIRAEALRRLEEAARTESDFLTVVDEWNKLDRNRERRERDHENLRGDVPLEFQAVPDPKIAPLWMNLPRFRQLCQGNFLDIIVSCPYELHELTANRFLSKLFFTLSDEQKEVLYYLFVKQYSTTRLAAIRGQSDRNIRKLRMTVQKKLQKQMYEYLSEKQEKDYSITLQEREFVEEYEALLQTMGKDAVIRRENKTKPRKKKATLDDAKDGRYNSNIVNI